MYENRPWLWVGRVDQMMITFSSHSCAWRVKKIAKKIKRNWEKNKDQLNNFISSTTVDKSSTLLQVIDPRGRPTVTAGSDHCFCTCRPSVRPHFSKQNKFQAKTMFASGETVDLAKWIIDDNSASCYHCYYGPNFLLLLLFPVSHAGHTSEDIWNEIKREIKKRSHQWSTRPAHSPGRQWSALYFEVCEGRTDGRTFCVKIVIINSGRPCGSKERKEVRRRKIKSQDPLLMGPYRLSIVTTSKRFDALFTKFSRKITKNSNVTFIWPRITTS